MSPAMADTSSEQPMVHAMNPSRSTPVMAVLIIVVLVVLGIGSGYLFTHKNAGGIGGQSASQAPSDSGQLVKGKVYGSSDEKAYPDSAEGTLEKGGLDGEGSHHLIRPGGDSQTAYLISSTLDLDLFVGKKVKVWGETNTSQKASWFMDVGRIVITE